MAHLEELLGNADADLRPLCDDAKLMTRIQSLPTWLTPETKTLK
jgi:hypothetical protein